MYPISILYQDTLFNSLSLIRPLNHPLHHPLHHPFSSGKKSISLSFGDSIVHEYEVEDYGVQNQDISRPGKAKGGKEKWGNFFDELKGEIVIINLTVTIPIHLT